MSGALSEALALSGGFPATGETKMPHPASLSHAVRVRMPKIPPATSNANSRIEFKLEVIQMLNERVKSLERERETVGRIEKEAIEKTITEFRTFRMEIESIEFKIDTRKHTNV